jgi:hypothetical protein
MHTEQMIKNSTTTASDEAVDRMFDDVLRCAAKLVANGKDFPAINSISRAFASLADLKDRDQRVKALGTLAVEAMKAQRKYDQSIVTAAVLAD